jgi:predicted enzyme related to lactoylglutathione lyase
LRLADRARNLRRAITLVHTSDPSVDRSTRRAGRKNESGGRRGTRHTSWTLAKPALDVGIVTTNFERMLGFYRDVLHFEALEPLAYPGMTVQRLVAGESILRLLVPEVTPPHESPNDEFLASTGLRYLTLAVTDVREVAAACKAAGAAVPMPPNEARPGVFVAQVQDPDGNWIEFMQLS